MATPSSQLTRRKSLFPYDVDPLESIVTDHSGDDPVSALELILDLGPFLASEQDLPALLLRLLDRVGVSLERDLGVQWSDESGLLLRGTHSFRGRTESLDERGDKGICDARVNQESSSGGASLPGRSKGSKKDASERQVLVRIGKYDGSLQDGEIHR